MAYDCYAGDGKVCDLAFQRHVRLVHRLGVRALAELLAEIDADPQHDVCGRLARYAGLDAGALHLAGGDRLPPSPPMLVPVMNKVVTGAADRREIVLAALTDRSGA